MPSLWKSKQELERDGHLTPMAKSREKWSPHTHGQERREMNASVLTCLLVLSLTSLYSHAVRMAPLKQACMHTCRGAYVRVHALACARIRMHTHTHMGRGRERSMIELKVK